MGTRRPAILPMLAMLVVSMLGVHAILTVMLLPRVLSPDLLHVSPMLHMLSVLIGWAIAVIGSPFTVVSLMPSRYAGVSPHTVSLVLNWRFLLVATVLAPDLIGRQCDRKSSAHSVLAATADHMDLGGPLDRGELLNLHDVPSPVRVRIDRTSESVLGAVQREQAAIGLAQCPVVMPIAIDAFCANARDVGEHDRQVSTHFPPK
jgi:hypothetical protein